MRTVVDVQGASRNRKLGAIAIAVVALAGVGTAYAASHLHSGSSAKNPAGNGGAFSAGPARGLPPANNGGNGNGFGFDRPGDGRGGFLGRPGGSFSAAASYLGISQAQLFADLRSGKTLAQIASSTSGKSAAGLIAAMVAAQQSRLDAAVRAGRITQATATQIEASMKTRITELVNGSFCGRGDFGLGRDDGDGNGSGGNGFGPPSQPSGRGQFGSGTSPT